MALYSRKLLRRFYTDILNQCEERFRQIIFEQQMQQRQSCCLDGPECCQYWHATCQGMEARPSHPKFPFEDTTRVRHLSDLLPCESRHSLRECTLPSSASFLTTDIKCLQTFRTIPLRCTLVCRSTMLPGRPMGWKANADSAICAAWRPFLQPFPTAQHRKPFQDEIAFSAPSSMLPSRLQRHSLITRLYCALLTAIYAYWTILAGRSDLAWLPNSDFALNASP